jgi:hypothetical protein
MNKRRSELPLDTAAEPLDVMAGFLTGVAGCDLHYDVATRVFGPTKGAGVTHIGRLLASDSSRPPSTRDLPALGHSTRRPGPRQACRLRRA